MIRLFLILFSLGLYYKSANAQIFGQNIKDDSVACFDKKYDKGIIVFVNNYSCHQCFYELQDSLLSKIDTSKVEITVILRIGNGVILRKGNLKEIKEIFPKSNKFLFDIQTSADPYPPKDVKEGLFGKFNIVNTPAILVWDNNENKTEKVFYYRDLFNSKGALNIKFPSFMKEYLLN